MAKNRIVNTKFWTDSFVMNDLNPVEKLVFIYLITNPHTDICGIYELPLKMMAVETGIDRDNLEKVILPRFEQAGKIMYRNGWVAIKNFIKHQAINPNVRKGIEDGLKKAPIELKSFVEGKPFESPSKPLKETPIFNTNTNTDTNTDLNTDTDIAPQSVAIPEVIDAFKVVNPSYRRLFGNNTQRGAAARLLEQWGKEKLLEMIGFLEKSNKIKYAPTITTPLQLEEKVGQLISFVEKERGEQLSSKIISL